MTKTVKIEVSDEGTAREIGFAILGRAQAIHDNKHDMYEDTAKEMKGIGRAIIEETK